MPVYVELLHQPSVQDLCDLGKIYADTPDWLLAPYASAAQGTARRLGNPSCRRYCARRPATAANDTVYSPHRNKFL